MMRMPSGKWGSFHDPAKRHVPDGGGGYCTEGRQQYPDAVMKGEINS